MFFKLFNRKQVRWFEYFFWFNFKIIYRLNKLNNATNNLNRAKTRFKKKKIMWQTILKQNNIHIQTCFFKVNVLNDDDVSFINIFNENFNDTNVFSETFNDEKSLKDQFVAACVQNEKYQQILKAFRIEKRILKRFSLVECTIVNN